MSFGGNPEGQGFLIPARNEQRKTSSREGR